MSAIFVYEDGGKGADKDCVSWTINSVRTALEMLGRTDLLFQSYKVDTINAEKIINEPKWKEECVLLVIPGGRDLPFCELLNGKGNGEIRDFVYKGGSYLGICAGAYYACRHIEFDKHNPEMCIYGSRELAFCSEVARGPYFHGFTYDSRMGACATSIILQQDIQHWASKGPVIKDGEIKVYFNGGPEFTATEESDDNRSLILANYMEPSTGLLNGSSRCMIFRRYGHGKVLLSGVHIEVSPEDLMKLNDPHLKSVCEEIAVTNHLRQTLMNSIVANLL